MDRLWGALLCIVVLAAVFAGMALAWRARRTRQAELDGIRAVPADAGAVIASADGLYLSTTPAGQPLERIAVAGLGFRARATLEVREHGVVLALDGVPERFIAAGDTLGAGRATWTIDRTVEPNGLLTFRWRLNGRELESSLRIDEPETTESQGTAALIAAIDRLATDRESA